MALGARDKNTYQHSVEVAVVDSFKQCLINIENYFRIRKNIVSKQE